MKILAISDEECPALWDYYTPGRLADYDLIISCGDLNAKYLSFLVTMAKCPVLYVHGNHDVNYDQVPPEGCDCIDGHIVEYNGIRILGLGGCRRYHPGPHQYSDSQMRARIAKLRWKLKRMGGVDIVVTHWGFDALVELIHKYHPPILVHGHVHTSYNHQIPREIEYQGTRVLNACERYVFEVEDRPVKTKNLYRVIYKTHKKLDSPPSMTLR